MMSKKTGRRKNGGIEEDAESNFVGPIPPRVVVVCALAGILADVVFLAAATASVGTMVCVGIFNLVFQEGGRLIGIPVASVDFECVELSVGELMHFHLLRISIDV